MSGSGAAAPRPSESLPMSLRGVLRALLPAVVLVAMGAGGVARAAGDPLDHDSGTEGWTGSHGGPEALPQAVSDWEQARDAWNAERSRFQEARYQGLSVRARARRARTAWSARHRAATSDRDRGPLVPAAVSARPEPPVAVHPEPVRPAPASTPPPAAATAATPAPSPSAGAQGGKPAWMVEEANRLEQQAGSWLHDDKPKAAVNKVPPSAPAAAPTSAVAVAPARPAAAPTPTRAPAKAEPPPAPAAKTGSRGAGPSPAAAEQAKEAREAAAALARERARLEQMVQGDDGEAPAPAKQHPKTAAQGPVAPAKPSTGGPVSPARPAKAKAKTKAKAKDAKSSSNQAVDPDLDQEFKSLGNQDF